MDSREGTRGSHTTTRFGGGAVWAPIDDAVPQVSVTLRSHTGQVNRNSFRWRTVRWV